MASSHLDIALKRLRVSIVSASLKHLTDADLVARFVARRDDAAFTALVHRHGGFVLNICRQVLGHEADAEDAFQASFLVLARKAASIRRQLSVAAWLHRVAFRCAKDLRKSRIRRQKYEEAARIALENNDCPLSRMTLNELQTWLAEEIDRLSESHRAPFILCCLEGKSRAEAAREMGWKEGFSRAVWPHAACRCPRP